MQKSGVKTLSIIDTISELAQNENEASRLTLPSPIKLTNSAAKKVPKVSVPVVPSPKGISRPKFNSADSVQSSGSVLTSSPLKNSLCHQIINVDRLNLSAISNESQFEPFVTISDRERPRNNVDTPAWIRDIFAHTQSANVDLLVESLKGLEPTLIRNLTDHSGNSLLHLACSQENAELLPWLCSKFGGELTGALNDVNRNGLTPVALAIKVCNDIWLYIYRYIK